MATRNVMISASPAPQSPAPSTPPPQKFVIVSQQKPPLVSTQPASGPGHIVVHSSQPTIVRSSNVQSVVVTSGPAGNVAPPQKVVVVGVQPQHHLAPSTGASAAPAVSVGLSAAHVSQAPVSVVAKPVFARGGAAPPPPELDDLSHLA